MAVSRYGRRVGKRDFFIIGIIALISIAVYLLDARRLNLLGFIGLAFFVTSKVGLHITSGDRSKLNLFNTFSKIGVWTASAAIFLKGLAIVMRQEVYAPLSDSGLLQGGDAVVQGIFIMVLAIGIFIFAKNA